MGPRFSSWRTALIGIVVIKAVLSLAVRPGSFVVSYSGISYFLLLLLATTFAIRNGIQNTLGRRAFWFFLATGYGLWSLNQYLQLHYELGLHVEVPQNSISDTLLFLHVVPLIAVVTALPCRDGASRKLSRVVLESFFLLFFWTFLYAYAVFPYQYLYSTSSYGARFDILYLAANLALVLAAGIFTLRLEAPWKQVCLHLFGASVLYSIGSAVANLAIDSGGYVNGKLYGLCLTASVCWFVWIPLQARHVASTKATTDDGLGSRPSLWATAMIVMISIPIVWELLHRNETTGLRTLRLFVAAAISVCFASAAYIKEYLARCELASSVGLANDKLREYERAVEGLEDMIAVVDREYRYLIANRKFLKMRNVTREQVVGRSVREILKDGFFEAVVKAKLDECFQGKVVRYETKYTYPEIGERDLLISYFPIEGASGIDRAACIVHDITDRKRSEESLRESEQRFRLAAQAGKMYSFEWDVATDVVVRSPEHVRVLRAKGPLGLSHEQFMNKVYSDDRAKLIATIAGLTPESSTAEVIYRVQSSDRGLIWLRGSGQGFFDSEGKLLRVIGMVADITDLKLAEEVVSGMTRKLVEAQEQERKRIARELHDDIGQRLALLSLDLTQLQENRPDSPYEVVKRVQELRQRTDEISTDVHSLSHELHSSGLEYLGVVGGIKSWCREFGERRGLQIDFESSGVPSSVPSEIALCLFRVLQEALHNAAKYSGVKRTDVKLLGQSGEINLIVSDSGKGFDVEAVEQGKGLGLTSMRERVRLMNGTIAIKSKPMAGTAILVRIPFQSEKGLQRAAT